MEDSAMKAVKVLGIAGGMVAAALVGGTLMNAASAAPGQTSTGTGTAADETVAGAYCEAWQEAFAAELGVDPDTLAPAGKAASIATIDRAVANGDLAADVAERMKERIEQADGQGCRLLGAGFHFLGRHAAIADWRHDWVATAADVLGMAPADLVAALRDGQGLADISEEQGIAYDDLSQAILDATEEDLQALVDAGSITQARADALLDQLEEKLEAGTFPPFGDGPRHGLRGGLRQGQSGGSATSS
jgi:hypothetical protein